MRELTSKTKNDSISDNNGAGLNIIKEESNSDKQSKSGLSEFDYQQYLSPNKRLGLNTRGSEDMSPISSNISSFYLDRIDELLPEKKLVTEKLFKYQ